jgi:hypothetical protein
MKKPYVQFSKRIVVAVTASVTAICLAALLLCYLIGTAEEVVLVVKAYISYAIVVFAAYSGNSTVEKWLIRKYKDEEGE